MRPVRRRLRLARAWAGRLALPLSVFVVFATAGSWPAPQPASAEFASDAALLAVSDAGSDEDASLVRHAFSPGVLALGVRRVIVDAGHGGDNLGTSSADGINEKDLTLDIAERVRAT